MLGTTNQNLIFVIWAIAAVFLVNRGGRNNGFFQIVAQSGYWLIFLGVVSAALIASNGSPDNPIFTSAAVNFVLILSAAVGANYISHANMSLRDNPNRPTGPEQLPWIKEEKSRPNRKQGNAANKSFKADARRRARP